MGPPRRAGCQGLGWALHLPLIPRGGCGLISPPLDFFTGQKSRAQQPLSSQASNGLPGPNDQVLLAMG